MTLYRILRRSIFLFCIASGLSQAIPYYGALLGSFHTVSNNVKGDVFAVDANTIYIKDFSYDGHSEDAVFWAGSSQHPDESGYAIPKDSTKLIAIPAYFNQNILLRLPEGENMKDMRWLSVWNRKKSTSLGTLIISKPILPPQPLAIGPLVNTKSGVSTGEILILDTQTFLVPNFHHDIPGKETYWWLSKGTKPGEPGIPLHEKGSDTPLKRYKNKTVIISLPKGHFITDYDTLSVWSRSDGDNYGFVDVPKNLNIPPSPRILGTQEPAMKEYNCEMLNDNLGLEVRWIIKGYDVIIHLVGNIGPSEYMALGISKDDTETRFDAADALVVGVDADGRGFALDYFFESNEKCENNRGMCPDSIHGSADNLELLQAERYENSTVVILKRSLRAEDKVYDQNIYTDGPQAILWAVGQLLSNGFIDSPTLQSKGNLLLDFGREPHWNCPLPKKRNPHVEEKTQHIHCPGDRSFRAQLGSSPRSSVKKVWFINGIPTPELTVQRGSTYTFLIEGGLNPPYYHPFYITNSKEGGLYKNILEANDAIEVTYAGIQQDHYTGTIFPTAEGRLCDWSYSDNGSEYSITSNQEVKQTMTLKCEPGQPGKLMWTPTSETPDEVYYQSFTERSLGGKIRVVDFCEETTPHRYLEIATKEGKPKTGNIELERESEIRESEVVSNMQNKESLSIKETGKKDQEEKENFNGNNSPPLPYENNPPSSDRYTLSSNIINSFTGNSDNIDERINEGENKQFFHSTNSPSLQVTEKPGEPFPHDESERSDVYETHHTELRKSTDHTKAAINPLGIKYPTHSSSEISSISALGKQPLQEFKPQFEGGFIPLVMNPMKEKENVQTKEIIYLPEHRRSHKPFLYNESVPFHGTFKPGVPDFSGFNISNYSQEDASIILAPNQEDISILSASKPQPVHKPFPLFGTLPLPLLQHHNVPPRQQRPHDFGNRFQQQLPDFKISRFQQQPSLVGNRKNVFPHLQFTNKPNFPIPHVREEDLTGVPSQRIYVSMQAIGDKKNNHANIPNLPLSSMYSRNTLPNKMIYPPRIQRRPDFYEKETNAPPSNVPQRNFNNPHISTNINNNQNHQKLNLPALQTRGLPGQINIRAQLPNIKTPPKNLQGKPKQTIMPQGHIRNPFPIMQVPPRERIPQIPLFPNGGPVNSNSQIEEKLKIIDGFINHPQNSGNIFPFQLHTMNKNVNNSEEKKESQILDSSKEHRNLPHLVNAELVEVATKNIPQPFPRENPTIYPYLAIQNRPLNGTLNGQTHFDVRNQQTTLNVSHGISSAFGILTNFSVVPNEPEKSISISKTEEIPPFQAQNSPFNSESHGILDQKFGSDRNEVAKQNEGLELNESYILESQQAVSHHQSDKSIGSSAAADILPSNPIKIELPIFLDYDPETDSSDNIDSFVTDADYSSYNVPFGARLKFPQNGSKIPIKTTETPKRPFRINNKPQIHLSNTRNKNLNTFAKPLEMTTSTTTPTTTTRRMATTTTEASLLAMESISNFALANKQNISFETNDFIKNLYYAPPLSFVPEVPAAVNSSPNLNQMTGSSNEIKHIPIIADELDGIVDASYAGRKTILLNNSSHSIHPFVVPVRVSENLNLPEILENLPTHDNRTDYSILNHVLHLIGGPPEQKYPDSSS